jgi:hypothetical protein
VVRNIIFTYISKVRIKINDMEHVGLQAINVCIANLTGKEAHDKGCHVWSRCYTSGDNREKHNAKVAARSA